MIHRCIDEETLVDFIEGRLSDKLRDEIEKHIAACPDCLDQIVIYNKLVYGEYTTDSAEVPQKITNAATDAICDQTGSDSFGRLKNTAQKILAKGKEAIERLTFVPMPAFTPIRGAGTDTTTDVIRIQKTINNLKFFAEMDRTGDRKFAVCINLVSEQPVLDDIRISLFAGEREIASSLWRGIPIVFEDIAFGTHALAFARNGEILSEYKFEIQVDLLKEG